jgi:hypothetical protein
MPAIYAAGKTPIAGRPEITGLGRSYPYTGYPVIAIDFVIGPITRRPEIAIDRARWLSVNG